MQRFADADLDGDGGLDDLEFDEFIGRFPAEALRRAADELAELPEEEAEDAEGGVAETFRALDGDSDGKITKEEMLTAVLQEAPADSGLAAAADVVFARADEDGDGRLDLREAETFLWLLGARLSGHRAEAAGVADAEVVPDLVDEDVFGPAIDSGAS